MKVVRLKWGDEEERRKRRLSLLTNGVDPMCTDWMIVWLQSHTPIREARSEVWLLIQLIERSRRNEWDDQDAKHFLTILEKKAKLIHIYEWDGISIVLQYFKINFDFLKLNSDLILFLEKRKMRKILWENARTLK